MSLDSLLQKRRVERRTMGDMGELVRTLGLLGCGMVSVSCATPLRAADLRPTAPVPELRGTLALGAEVSGFYLRGDIGFSNQSVERLSNSLDALGTIEKVNLAFAGAPFAGGGVGYRFNQ